MAQQDISQYKYAAMSNLVLQHDRRFTTRRGDEATGDPESLAGQISVRDMGNRVSRIPPNTKKTEQGVQSILSSAPTQRSSIHEGADILAREQRKRKRGYDPDLFGAQNAPTAESLVEGLRYTPQTPATRAIYSLVLAQFRKYLMDVPQEVILSAADASLEVLKNPDLKDIDKKREIDDILQEHLTPQAFNELLNLGKKLTDYNVSNDHELSVADANAESGGVSETLDERQGVAVMFEDDEDDAADEEDGLVDEVRSLGGSSTTEDDEDVGSVRNKLENDTGVSSDEADTPSTSPAEGTIPHAFSAASRGIDYTLPTRDIDAFWIQRQVGKIYKDPHEQQTKSTEAFSLLSAGLLGQDHGESSDGELENDLMSLFDFEHHSIVRLLVANREKIVFMTQLARLDDATEKANLERTMYTRGQGALLAEIRGNGTQARSPSMIASATDVIKSKDDPDPTSVILDAQSPQQSRRKLFPNKQLTNLDDLVFDQGNHLLSSQKVTLPAGSIKRSLKGWEEIHVPAPTNARPSGGQRKNIEVRQLPDWAQEPFRSSGTTELNRVQSHCFPVAFEEDGNMLICAPTGSGKTNVALLAILREISHHRDPSTGELDLRAFKIVYIAPLKALVQEQVGAFRKRLACYGITAAELTGDSQLTKQQITATQVIVTTPEKWDIITRKATDASYTRLVRLIIIDEIHLLHDDRGPVIESIVSRQIRRMEHHGDRVRLVGLSATLPNYRDVASFLRVDPARALFHFDATYRPVPLRQEFVGVTEKKAIKQIKTMNEVTYIKTIERAGSHQVLIFVHSRKETAKTARYIRDKALEFETIGRILRSDAASKEILREEADQAVDKDLRDLLPYGFAIHHAGMSRTDRTIVENLFDERYVQVLVCTATLAWGVNLPAHTVIIKGTQIYSPERGRWVELSPQDVLQMLGRAGRPQHDTSGEGIIITTHSEVQYYLSLLNQQLPIESQLIGKLIDSLNAEVVLGSVRNREDAVDWLGYTYLFVRMLRSPGLYRVGAEYEDDHALEQKRVDLTHSAATALSKANLIKYDVRSGKMQSTELGRVASHYYISHKSIQTYGSHLQASASIIELFRTFALSDEFKYIPVRQDEKLELARLLTKVPIPVKESIEEPAAKINVLLQAYISRLKLDGLALMADLIYVTQSAGRILRAIFEIALQRGWSSVTKLALDLCKTAEKRIWPTMSPLRQFPTCDPAIVRKAERVEMPWDSYFDLDPPRMGELLGMPQSGNAVCELVQKFPRLDVNVSIQPITRSHLQLQLEITPRFRWDNALHGTLESFWILVEDADGETILCSEQFLLRGEYALQENCDHLVEMGVMISEPLAPNYFISVISDRWMHSATQLPVSLQKLVLPTRFPPPTNLLEMQPLTVGGLKDHRLARVFDHITQFNKLQTQVYNVFGRTSESCFVGAPSGAGKTICAEFSIIRHQDREDNQGKIIYICPDQSVIDRRYTDWSNRLQLLFKPQSAKLAKLSGEVTSDLKLLEHSALLLGTPVQFDAVTRQWHRRRAVQAIRLVIADELHMIGEPDGFVYELLLSRLRFMATQIETDCRFVGLSVPISDPNDIKDWLGIGKNAVFNFSPHNRPLPLTLHLQTYAVPHFPSFMLTIARPAYQAVLSLSPAKSALLFVSGRRQVRSTVADIAACCAADEQEERFLHVDAKDLAPIVDRIEETTLASAISLGIGYYHEALSSADKRIVTQLFHRGAVQILICSREAARELEVSAYLVIIMGTQYYEGREHRYVEYPLSDLLHMMGRANRPRSDQDSRAVLMTSPNKKEFYKKFLNEALPIESHLPTNLHDMLMAEISSRAITSSQDAVEWTYQYTLFYRRLLSNPSFYGLTDTTNEGISSHLSELVETTIRDLTDAKVIDFDEDEDALDPLSSAVIASYYGISFTTIQTFVLSLNAKTRTKGFLEILSSAAEFEKIAVRRHEGQLLRQIYDRLPLKVASPDYDSPQLKAFILLQAHLSRLQLPVDLAKDQEVILLRILDLLGACIDLLSSDGHVNSLRAMELSQMVVQALWSTDSSLKQIPFFGEEQCRVASEAGIHDVLAFMEAMDPSDGGQKTLVQALRLDQGQLLQAARFTNDYYPDVEMEHSVIDAANLTAGSAFSIRITLQRESEDNDIAPAGQKVHAPFFPKDKTEGWWVVLTDKASRGLLAIKRVTFSKSLETKLDAVIPQAGLNHLTLSLICDSYIGVDQEQQIDVSAQEPDDRIENGGGSDSDE